MQVLQQQQTQR